MLKIVLTFFLLLMVGVSIVAARCPITTYTPPSLFRFGQQIFWDERTNSIYVADASVPDGSPSIIRFDWTSRTWHSASITDTDNNKPVSFIVPAASSSNILIGSQGTCVTRLEWDGVSSTAKKITNIACRSPTDVNLIDRGAVSPDGTLYMSIIPSTHCNKTATFPAAAIEFLDLGSGSPVITNALTPGTYSNGIVFDAAASESYIADDCSSSILANRWNTQDKSLTYLRSVFEFPRATRTTNYPSGLVIDTCSNIYIGDHNSGRVYYVNPKTGRLVKIYKVPGTHITAVGIVGPNLNYLCVLTGIPYHDIYNGLQSNSTNPGDGKMYLIRICPNSYARICHGKPGKPVAGF